MALLNIGKSAFYRLPIKRGFRNVIRCDRLRAYVDGDVAGYSGTESDSREVNQPPSNSSSY